MRVIVSPVGISLFFNVLEKGEAALRQQLNQHSNDAELSEDFAMKVEELSGRAKQQLQGGDVQERRRLSAELNGLYGLNEGHLTANGDIHILIATDTALGRMAAQIVYDFLRETIRIRNVQVIIPESLNTASVVSFSSGIKELLNRFEQMLPGYADSGYEIIFNLTGGFKSLQGYLNIIGMFYADRLVYIFERSDELLDIPRLPIQMDINALRHHRLELAMMAQKHLFPLEQVEDIPDSLLETVEVEGEKVSGLSGWGSLVWNRVRDKLLQDELLPFPRLQYTGSFRRDFKKASSRERVSLQEDLAKVASMLEEAQGDTSVLRRDGGLLYNNYTSKTTADGRPIGHFRVSQSKRVSCTVEDGALRLRHYGEEPVVNENP